MPVPEPRYLSRHSKTRLANPPASRWTARRKYLAALPTPTTPTPTPVYTISGTLIPDATGDLYADGDYDGHPSYRLLAGTFFLWYNTTFSLYMISPTKGDYSNCWFQEGPSIESTYAPFGAYAGQATVSAA